MYLHIGGERIIALKEIIAVLQARPLESAPDGAAFLKMAQAAGRLVRTGEERPNSYVVTTNRVYASSLSAGTLRRRAENPQSLSDGE